MTLLVPEWPVLKRHLQPTIIGHDEVFIFSEDRAWLWKSRELAVLLPRLDGTRTLSDLFDIVGDEISPPQIVFLLKRLHDHRLLASGSDGPSSAAGLGERAFRHALGVDGTESQSRQVEVRTLGEGSRLAEALAAAGIATEGEGRAALRVVETHTYLDPSLLEMNRAHLADGTPWMVCKLIGQTLWIGPIFQPGRTACLACLRDRLRLNRRVEEFAVRKTGSPAYYATSLGSIAAMTQLGVTFAASEIGLWLEGCTARLDGTLIAIRFGERGTEVSAHPVVRRPQCPECGDPLLARRPVSVTLQERPVTSGAHARMMSPEATLRRLGHHISPLTGVVTHLSDLARDPEGIIHSYSAGHSMSFGIDSIGGLRNDLCARTGGKGATAAEARASAVCEAIERYCGTFREDIFCIRSSYELLQRDCVHPYDCLNFSSRQYAERDALNGVTPRAGFDLIPRPFCKSEQIDWVPLWSLSSGKVRHVPAALCYHGHPDVERHFYCASDANGCASGNVLEEAILYGFLELAERDSTAIWWYNQLRRPAIDLDSANDPYIERVRDRYQRDGRDLWAIDITADLEIPTIAAVSRRLDGPADDLIVGLAAHLDTFIALRRAIFELNQFLPAVSGRRPDGGTAYLWPDDIAVRFWKNETLVSQPQLVPDPTVPARVLSQMPRSRGTDLRDSVQICLDAAGRRGLDVLVLDQSRPDIELSVARVVVPGLRHFWRRLGPGRLYEVPVELGWVAEPTRESELNPTALYF